MGAGTQSRSLLLQADLQDGSQDVAWRGEAGTVPAGFSWVLCPLTSRGLTPSCSLVLGLQAEETDGLPMACGPVPAVDSFLHIIPVLPLLCWTSSNNASCREEVSIHRPLSQRGEHPLTVYISDTALSDLVGIWAGAQESPTYARYEQAQP